MRRVQLSIIQGDTMLHMGDGIRSVTHGGEHSPQSVAWEIDLGIVDELEESPVPA